mmetsp:Transcript_30419/g.116613  ORF Transcript_30419/g.116613 Transcript_30419/m.116613 type:complete len:263 (-) Transcript_30419:110-898(-)|eukprot:CAMPEP_0113962594 /NCGR_PEP_ID=MMETSP0011_2-20120614/6010_1 /TAXON_ID=101924 /ORGANISM="Rhodosorus marinus" /LENGTH=262 /DNA_ID=CAMNT_0000974481 /DNA_START=137 /DNA_END=925 /DNA_ORIENTATION=- /assembly_acc=CAM_ASM_000156
MFWKLRNEEVAKAEPVKVAKATYADDFDNGYVSMLVTHTSKNLKELSKCQTLNVKGFYNVNDNQKVFAEIDPIGRAISGIGLKLKQVDVADQKFMNELIYSPSGDSARARVEWGESNTKIGTELSFKDFSKAVFDNHNEEIMVSSKFQDDQIKVTGKYSVQGQSLKGKVRYTNGNYILQGEAKASAKALDGFRASVEKVLNNGAKVGIHAHPSDKRGAIQYKSNAENLPFSLTADFPFDSSASDLVDNTTVTFGTRINVFNK